MRITRSDMKQLHLQIGAAALLIALGAAGVVASDHYLSQATTEREAAKQQRIQAQKRVEQVAEEEREIRQNLLYYKSMTEHGMAAEENRLDLIDSIARIKKERRLFDIRYQIEPQKSIDYAGIKPAKPLDLVASRLKLDMLLLHEQDLLAVLDDLERSGKVYVSVRGCSIARVDGADIRALTVAPRLRASCQVDLVAIQQAQSS